MSWDARQRAMLAEMGFRLPAAAAVAAEAEVVELAEPEPQAPVAVVPPPAIVRVAAPVMLAAPAAPSGFAGLDLPALREAVSACRGCGLCEQRRHAVFGNGALQQVQWLVVTDPPDEADDASGQALGGQPSGDAGRLLDRMLLAAGQRRGGDAASAFVTPIVKCRPPRGRAPQPAELQACEAVLAAQVELLQPRLVLALGLQAARRLTGLTEPLGRLRGRVHRWRDLPVVVSFHPAYLLRSPADKAGAWDDLCLARRTLQAS
ncbi:MAG: uracil-DNA glycosylase [Comamonadaceae bacterium]|nr:uracil-DNA glycosylase [Comamonadaceae bacterium]